MSAYQVNLLYQFFEGGTILATLLFVWLGLGLARRHGRQEFIRWLTAFFVGDVLQLLLWFFSTFWYFIWHPVPRLVSWIFYFGYILPNLIFVYAVAVIWQTLRPKGKVGGFAGLNEPHPKEPELPV